MSVSLTPPGAGAWVPGSAALLLCTHSEPALCWGWGWSQAISFPPAGAAPQPQRLPVPFSQDPLSRDPGFSLPTQQGVGLGGPGSPLEAGGLQQGLESCSWYLGTHGSGEIRFPGCVVRPGWGMSGTGGPLEATATVWVRAGGQGQLTGPDRLCVSFESPVLAQGGKRGPLGCGRGVAGDTGRDGSGLLLSAAGPPGPHSSTGHSRKTCRKAAVRARL